MNHLELIKLSRLAVIILVAAYIIFRQVSLRPVKPSNYIVFPIILFYLTLNEIAGLKLDIYKEIAPMLLLLSIGLVSGTASGLVTKIFTKEDGILYQKGGAAAAILLLFMIPLRYALRHSIASIPGGEVLQISGVSYLIMISSQCLSRSLTVLIRCPQVWSLHLQQRRDKKARKRLNNG